jgi:hypothetical protein
MIFSNPLLATLPLCLELKSCRSDTAYGMFSSMVWLLIGIWIPYLFGH